MTGRALALLCGWHESKVVRADRLRLLREGDHRFFVVIEESVLRTVIGGAEVMAGQLGDAIKVEKADRARIADELRYKATAS